MVLQKWIIEINHLHFKQLQIKFLTTQIDRLAIARLKGKMVSNLKYLRIAPMTKKRETMVLNLIKVKTKRSISKKWHG